MKEKDTPREFDSAPSRSAFPAPHVTCPFCHSRDTEVLAIFGSQLSTLQYYCHSCHTPFEHMKQDDAE